MLITTDVAEIASLLNTTKGSVIACPTETFYGLSARIIDTAAIKRIIRVKGRAATKGMIVLVPDMETVCRLAQTDERSRNLLGEFWPGPLSAVLRAKQEIHELLAPAGRIAVRISPHSLIRSLVEKTGPVTSTSANISGGSPASTVGDIIEQHLDIDAILDGGQTPGGKPSTLIDLTVWPPVCVREGVVPFDAIERAVTE